MATQLIHKITDLFQLPISFRLKKEMKNIHLSEKWYDVSEHTPEEGRYVICCRLNSKEIHFACFSFQQGWIDNHDNSLGRIDIWLDALLPFDVKIKENED